jgi:hypothetical protein
MPHRKRDNGWSDKVYQVCNIWLRRAASAEQQYHAKLVKTIKQYKFTHLFRIIISAIGSALSFYNATDVTITNSNFRISLAVGILGVISTVASAWEIFLDYPGQVQFYKRAQGKYAKIVRNLEIAINATVKPKADEFLNHISDCFWKYQEESNSPTQEVIGMFNLGVIEGQIVDKNIEEEHHDAKMTSINKILDSFSDDEDLINGSIDPILPKPSKKPPKNPEDSDEGYEFSNAELSEVKVQGS